MWCLLSGGWVNERAALHSNRAIGGRRWWVQDLSCLNYECATACRPICVAAGNCQELVGWAQVEVVGFGLTCVTTPRPKPGLERTWEEEEGRMYESWNMLTELACACLGVNTRTNVDPLIKCLSGGQINKVPTEIATESVWVFCHAWSAGACLLWRASAGVSSPRVRCSGLLGPSNLLTCVKENFCYCVSVIFSPMSRNPVIVDHIYWHIFTNAWSSILSGGTVMPESSSTIFISPHFFQWKGFAQTYIHPSILFVSSLLKKRKFFSNLRSLLLRKVYNWVEHSADEATAKCPLGWRAPKIKHSLNEGQGLV